MIKANIDLMHEFYYGHNLKKAIGKITNAESSDFVGMGYDDSNKENIKDISLEAEIELKGHDELIEFEVTGEVKDNVIIFNNDYNNKSIIFNLQTGEYIY